MGEFLIKKEEPLLSVSWVEYFGEPRVDKNMLDIKKIVGRCRKLKESGRFSVISVERPRRMVIN